LNIRNFLLSSILVFTSLQAQSTIGFDVNNKDVEAFGSIDLNTFADYSEGGLTYLIDGSYLYADGDDLGSLGFSAQNSFEGVEGLAFVLGAKFVFADNFTALPLFGKAIYTLPLDGVIPTTSVSGTFAYSPEVLSFSDATHYKEFRAEADMQLAPSLHLFAGYRNIDTEYLTIDKTFNDSFYGGMKFGF